MRQCYRCARKLPAGGWRRMVAKRFKRVGEGLSEEQMLREDVVLQVEAGQLAQKFNKAVPAGAKKVDFMHCYVVELRPAGIFSRSAPAALPDRSLPGRSATARHC